MLRLRTIASSLMWLPFGLIVAYLLIPVTIEKVEEMFGLKSGAMPPCSHLGARPLEQRWEGNGGP